MIQRLAQAARRALGGIFRALRATRSHEHHQEVPDVGAATYYPHRGGATAGRRIFDEPTQIIRTTPLMTRGAEYRSSFAFRRRNSGERHINTGEHYR